jgi:hypothetical protein
VLSSRKLSHYLTQVEFTKAYSTHESTKQQSKQKANRQIFVLLLDPAATGEFGEFNNVK